MCIRDRGISEDLSAFLRSSTSSNSNTTSDDSSGSSSTSSTSSSTSSSSSSDASVSPRKVRARGSASGESSSSSSSSVSPASPTKKTKQQLPVVPVVEVENPGVSDSPRPKVHDRTGHSDKRHNPPTSTHEHIHRLAVASRFWNLFKDGAQTDPESPMRKSHLEFPNAACGRSPSVSVREDPSAHLPQTLMRINPMLNSSVDSLQGLLAAGEQSK
eukprot:TRINITY_DN25011_c0_g1_i3.p1 TRINITY_DN25011_c0_g1~~TRINITY_DN25011_c0_g1_i3.p1  ORF type:complete len:215 (+),score=22.45 TRINITY_DN25011_c0_g1_i3:175-819(+)